MAKNLVRNPHRYNFDKFIESIADLDGAGMLRHLLGEYNQAEAAMSGRGGPQARLDGVGDYAKSLKSVIMWFQTNFNFSGPGVGELGACRRLAQGLIARGELPSDFLK